MRRIVLYISIVISLLGCSDRVESEAEYCSIASLWRYARRGTSLITEDIYICGSVVANDKYGELNGAIVVADGSGGVELELDMDNIATIYPLHSKVEICCSGLWLGSVGPKLMLGAEPTGEYVVDRIAANRALNHISALDKESDTPTISHRRIAELGYRDVLSYVAVEGVALVDDERGRWWTDIDTLLGEPITTVRHFVQGNDTIRVVTDARCDYATEYIPASTLTLSGLLDWYDGDIALRIVDHSVETFYL